LVVKISAVLRDLHGGEAFGYAIKENELLTLLINRKVKTFGIISERDEVDAHLTTFQEFESGIFRDRTLSNYILGLNIKRTCIDGVVGLLIKIKLSFNSLLG
jgi:hypothetical protein